MLKLGITAKMRKAAVAGLTVLAVSAPAFAGSNAPRGWGEEKDKQKEKAKAYAYAFSTGGSRSYLGVDVEDVTKERLAELKLSEERGVEIRVVDQDAPAGKAGLKGKDVILQFNGERVESAESLRRMIKETPPGRTVTLTISREGQQMPVQVALGDRMKDAKENVRLRDRIMVLPPDAPEAPFAFRPMPMPRPEIPPVRVWINSTAKLGITIESLTPQLGEFFGVREGRGVLVRAVEKGSPAEQAGIKAGDVITRIGSEEITDRSDFRRMTRTLKAGNVQLGLVRDKREMNVTLNVPESKVRETGDLEIELPDFDIELPTIALDTRGLRADLSKALDEAYGELEKARPEIEKAFDLQTEAIERAAEEAVASIEDIDFEAPEMPDVIEAPEAMETPFAVEAPEATAAPEAIGTAEVVQAPQHEFISAPAAPSVPAKPCKNRAANVAI